MLEAAAADAEGNAKMVKSSSCDCDRAFGSGVLSPLTHLAKDDDLRIQNWGGGEQNGIGLVAL